MSPQELRKLTNEAISDKLKTEQALSKEEIENWYNNEFTEKATGQAKRGYSCLDLYLATRSSGKINHGIQQLIGYLESKGYKIQGFFVYW